MTDQKPEGCLAIVRGLQYASSIVFVSFDDEAGGEIRLIGDRRMVEPIRDYIGREVQLFITSETEWTWMPVDDGELEESN